MNKTKIVCTIGPASMDKEILKEMILNGMNVARINMSHGNDYTITDRIIKNVKEVSKELKMPVGILVDTKGPELRIGKLNNDQITLKKGSIITIVEGNIIGDNTTIPVNYDDLYKDVRVGNKIILNEGTAELIVKEIEEKQIVCEVLIDGEIEANKGVNVPDAEINLPFLSKKDIDDITYAVEKNVEYLALSFVRTLEDVNVVKDLLINLNSDIDIIAKIENDAAIFEMEDIIKHTEGVMVARGDLGIEIPMEEVPRLQKELIKKANELGKISIVATEMLSSMEQNARPTRAEVSDVANAVLDGADAVMLSGETAIGNHPVETVGIMRKIVETTEATMDYDAISELHHRDNQKTVTEIIAYNAVDVSNRLEAKSIIVTTKTGLTAKEVSKYRPACPIIATCPDIDIVRKLTLSWGIIPVYVDMFSNTDEVLENAKRIAKQHIKLESHDKIVITGSIPLDKVKTTNFLEVEEIK